MYDDRRVYEDQQRVTAAVRPSGVAGLLDANAPQVERSCSLTEIAMNELQGQNHELQVVIKQLSERLHPVLRSREAEPKSSGQTQACRPQMDSPLPEAIMFQAETLTASTTHLRDLISQLAI